MTDHDDSLPFASDPSVAAVYEAVAAALADHDKATAVRTAVEAVSSGAVSIPALYRDVLSRILRRHRRGVAERRDRHLGGAPRQRDGAHHRRDRVSRGAEGEGRGAPASGRSVLLACPPEEAHDLGLRMVADRFDMAGWTTYFLGPDTPVAEIADAARRLGVDAVVMSSSTHFHRLAVRHAVDALKKELPGHGHLGRRPGLRRRRDRVAAAGDRGPRGTAWRGGGAQGGGGLNMLSLSIAARFLRKSPVQSILIAAGIAVGIGVQVFLGSLITSLQASLVDQTIGNSPQVVVLAGQDGAADHLHVAARAGDEGAERDHHRRADPHLLGDLPQRQRERAAPDHRRRARPARHHLRHLRPSRRRQGVARRGRGHRRQGVRRPVRAEAGRHGLVRAAERRAGGPQGLRRVRLRLGRRQQRTAFVGGDQAAEVLGYSADAVLGRRRPGRRRLLVGPGGRRPEGRTGARRPQGHRVAGGERRPAVGPAEPELLELHDPGLRAGRRRARHRLDARHRGGAEDAADRHPQGDGPGRPPVRAHLPVAGADPRRERRRRRRRGGPRPHRPVHLPRAQLGVAVPDHAAAGVRRPLVRRRRAGGPALVASSRPGGPPSSTRSR